MQAAPAAYDINSHTKEHLTIGTIGHVDHGKTTLTAAITKVGAGQSCGHLRPHAMGSGLARRMNWLTGLMQGSSSTSMQNSDASLQQGGMRAR